MDSTIRRTYVDCRFGQLHITTGPENSDATPVILMNTRARTLNDVVSLLPPTLRGINIDIPGSGLSSPPTAGSSMSDIAGCVVDYLDASGIERAHVFGFHTGHKVGTALAADHPDRVNRVIIAGKTHSIIPERDKRVPAMEAYIARSTPDVLLVEVEGKYVDDGPGPREAREAMYAANFAFDFQGAASALRSRTLVLEVVTDEEDHALGRQGEALAAVIADATAVTIPQVDPTGLQMYVGKDRLASAIVDFLAA